MKSTPIILLGIFLWMQFAGYSQLVVTLEDCIEKSLANHPLAPQFSFLENIHQVKDQNLSKNYYPQLYINGQATYQSDVISLPDIEIPGIDFGSVAKDQYKASLDVNQLIYDAGKTKNLRKLEESSWKISEQELKVKLFETKQTVVNVYFNILLLDQQHAILLIHQESIKSQLEEILELIRQGVLLKAQADVLQAELIGLNQKITENEMNLIQGINTMQILTKDTTLSVSNFIHPPDIQTAHNLIPLRPENVLFSQQKNQLMQMKEMQSVSRKPLVYVFGQAGYGRPGYNYLSNEFEDFYMVGAKINWHLWDWKVSGEKAQIYELQSAMVDQQEEVFLQGIHILLEQKQADIHKFDEWIRQDTAIIELRKSILETSSSQLKNGNITSNQYLLDAHALRKAELDLELHRVMLTKSKYEYQLVLGKL